MFLGRFVNSPHILVMLLNTPPTLPNPPQVLLMENLLVKKEILQRVALLDFCVKYNELQIVFLSLKIALLFRGCLAMISFVNPKNFNPLRPLPPPFTFFAQISKILTYITFSYFSLNIWQVYEQLEVDGSLSKIELKLGVLYLQIFQILNSADRLIFFKDAVSFF